MAARLEEVDTDFAEISALLGPEPAEPQAASSSSTPIWTRRGPALMMYIREVKARKITQEKLDQCREKLNALSSRSARIND